MEADGAVDAQNAPTVPLENVGPDGSPPDQTSSVLEATAEGLTALLSSKKQPVLSVGHVLQQTRSLGFLAALNMEWKRLRGKGRIKDDYPTTAQHQNCLQELLASLDNDLPDDTRFAVLRKILLVTATEEHSHRDDVTPAEYMRLARSLKTGELLLLQAAHRCADDATANKIRYVEWTDMLVDESGLKHKELVHIYRRTLIEKHLMHNAEGMRYLTPLGAALIDFIGHYEPENQENSE